MKRGSKSPTVPPAAVWRQAILQAYGVLQDWFDHYTPADDAAPFDRSLWGEKDSYLSTLIRLIQLDMKLTDMQAGQERDGAATRDSNPMPESWDLTHEEWELLAEACTRQLADKKKSPSLSRGKSQRSKR